MSRKLQPKRNVSRETREAKPAIAAVDGAVGVFELAIGQSSVELTIDSKGLVKPGVKVYHRDPDEAFRVAQEIFDAAVIKYVQGPAEIAKKAA